MRCPMHSTVLILGLALASASPLAAGSGPPLWGLGLHAGWNGYAMESADTGRSESVAQGPGLGLQLRFRPCPYVEASFGSEVLLPQERSTRGQFLFHNPLAGGALTPWDYELRERYSALETLAQAWLVLPWGAMDLRLGGGGGWVSLAGASLSSDAPGARELLLFAAAPSWRVALGAEWRLDRHFSTGLEAGWRWCRLEPEASPGLELEYSGLSTRLSGTFWF